MDLTDEMYAAMPFTRVLGAQAVAATPEEVRVRLAWTPERCTSGGLLHGGATLALADAAGGWCGFLNLPEGARGTATTSSSANFLRPVTGGAVEAVARVLNAGRSAIVVVVDVLDERGRLTARVTQSQAVLGGVGS
ncbi:PaaI family thioesterase [Pseudonocardia pini]|uniref:PaaI family thioesterase n=1 Tax=Pseudonocardia pini TaxID=2758030 RepID=UPI001FE76ACC|nr:PaaI family thioesterase [Pseudonocardia pini]